MAVILIADDCDEIRTLYGAALRHRGHEVHEAADGAAAIDAARAIRPDLLLLDVWMPRANGFEVLEGLAGEATGSRLRVVMLSVLDDGDTQLEAFGGGAVEYLVKGVALQELVGRVEAILATSPAGCEDGDGPDVGLGLESDQ